MAVYTGEFTCRTHRVISTVHTYRWINSSVAGSKRVTIRHSRTIRNITACSFPSIKTITLLCNKQTHSMTTAVDAFAWTTHCFTFRASPPAITDTFALFTPAVAVAFRATVNTSVAATTAASIPTGRLHHCAVNAALLTAFSHVTSVTRDTNRRVVRDSIADAMPATVSTSSTLGYVATSTRPAGSTVADA